MLQVVEDCKEVALNIEHMESAMLDYPQVECPVEHFFGEGIYIRQVKLPAGALVVGHHQKTDHLNVMLQGKVAILDEGTVRVLQAPLTFVGKAGRKIGYIIEDVVWQNVYATHEKNVDILEETFLDKSLTWEEYNRQSDAFLSCLHQEDRDDFNSVLEEYGFTEEQVRTQSEDESDILNHITPSWISVRDSNIEGKGIFTSQSIKEGERIDCAKIGEGRTLIGRYVNHSAQPNCYFDKRPSHIMLVAKHDIFGCLGGSKGSELTVDYRESLKLLGVNPCRE